MRRSGEEKARLRVGVIGLGFAGTAALMGFGQLPEVEVVALAGQEEERLAELGAAHGIPNLVHDYRDLLELDLDAVSVAAPNSLHAPIVIGALDRGFHVLCEKPLARSAAEAELMVEAANRNDRVLDVVFSHRRRGDVQVVKETVDAGKLGDVYYAKAWWMRRRGIPGLGSWFVSKDTAGGGCLIDLGVHVLDMSLYLLGEPEVLTVSASTFDELGRRGIGFSPRSRKTGSGNAFEVEDLATAFLRLSNGATLQLETSWATHSSWQDDYGVALYGTEAGAEIKVNNYATMDTLRIYTNLDGEPVEIEPELAPMSFHAGVVRDFVDHVLGGDWGRHRGTEGLRYARIIDACYRSAAEGRELALDGAGLRLEGSAAE
jgi:predicted dehydrogenase